MTMRVGHATHVLITSSCGAFSFVHHLQGTLLSGCLTYCMSQSTLTKGECIDDEISSAGSHQCKQFFPGCVGFVWRNMADPPQGKNLREKNRVPRFRDFDQKTYAQSLLPPSVKSEFVRFALISHSIQTPSAGCTKLREH